jgi:hypothetical protein
MPAKQQKKKKALTPVGHGLVGGAVGHRATDPEEIMHFETRHLCQLCRMQNTVRTLTQVSSSAP